MSWLYTETRRDGKTVLFQEKGDCRLELLGWFIFVSLFFIKLLFSIKIFVAEIEGFFFFFLESLQLILELSCFYTLNCLVVSYQRRGNY